LRKKVTTNAVGCAKKQQPTAAKDRDEDDIDVNFLSGGPKESSEVGRKKLPKPNEPAL